MEYGLELYHHGVKGQHWGKRNGPPYPLYRKSAYYKKTGQRPPGYTGNKKGKSDSGGTNKSGRVGGLKEQLLAGTAFDKSEKGRKAYTDYQKYRASVYLRGAAGAGLGAAAGAAASSLTKRDIKTGLAAGAALGSTAGSLSALPKYVTAVKSMRARRREIREKDKRGRIGGIDDSKSEKRKQLAKKIAIGAGTAAALAGAGYLAYRNRGRIAKDFRTIETNAKTDYYKARGKIFNSKAYESVERRLNDPRIRLAKRKAGYMAKDVGNKVKFETGKRVNSIKTSAKEFARNPRAELQYRLGNIPGTAKLNSARVAAKNRITSAINRAKSAPGKIKNEFANPTSALRNDVRLVGASAKGMARKAGNVAKSGALKVKATAAKPGQTVYNKIAGKSKSALKAAKIESQYARNNSRTLKRFIDDNSQQIEKATIAKRKALAQIRRGEGNIKELNKAANNWAAKEKALIAKQNTAKALAPRAAADRISKAEAVRQAQEVFNKRNKLGRIAAGATNAGIGLGLAGAAGGAGYGISKLARSGKKKNQNRGTIGGLTKRMTASSTDSAVTRRAKAAYNSMSDAEFRRKYSVSKAEYARRVEKYGDPYKNSPMAKLGRRLSRRRRRR